MQIRVGARLRSAVDTTEVVIIRADRDDAVLTCGGAPMVLLDGSSSARVPVPGQDAGTELGKRYTDVDSSFEILCTKAGPGALCVDGGPMQLKQAKSLPASD
jgi:hypothetical protein